MKKIFKKNQVIITALAIMIAVAWYINYSDNYLGLDKTLEKVSSKTADEAQETAETDGIVEEIESLDYDPQRNVVVGKIRLLNTAKGKDAQALVRDGIPLHISSRAAGTVDESGHVKLQQLFTYDLVADPGFANAVFQELS